LTPYERLEILAFRASVLTLQGVIELLLSGHHVLPGLSIPTFLLLSLLRLRWRYIRFIIDAGIVTLDSI
jgi:hypothetical protein